MRTSAGCADAGPGRRLHRPRVERPRRRRHRVVSVAWSPRTTCSSSVPAAQACARRSRRTTRGAKVAVISKLHPTRSHSGAAEGGINAALGNKADDSPETHAFDTVKGSDYLGDQDAIEIFTAEAPGDIYQLEHWGCVFSRNADGRLDQRPFGAAGLAAHGLRGRHHRPRAHPGALRAAAAADGGRPRRLRGVLRLPARRRRRPLHGRHLLGPPERRRQARHRQGRDPRDGRRRPPLPRDDERLCVHRRRHVDGAARGTAAEGHRVHAVPSRRRCTRAGSSSPRAAAARAATSSTRTASASCSATRRTRSSSPRATSSRARRRPRSRPAAGSTARSSSTCATSAPRRSSTKLPGSRELAMTYAGVDPIYAPIPVRPGAHYHMGGVETDNWGLTEIEGLYAAGEVACVSVHGANRLGGNSLMETITFGRRSGQAAAEYALGAPAPDGDGEAARADAEAWVKGLLANTAGERPWAIRDELGQSMLENFGVFRRAEKMEAQIDDHRRPARALRARRRHRGQGRRLQQRPHAGDRARLPARHRRVHAAGGARAARRAAAPTRGRTTSRTATTRTSSSTRSRAGRTAARSSRTRRCG